MKTITCPHCGAPIAIYRAFRPTVKPFCAHCGWNLQRAEIAVAGKNSVAKLVPIGIAVVALLVALTAAKAHTAGLLVAALVIGAVMLLPYWAFVSTRKAIAAAKSSVNPSLALAQPPLDPALQPLPSLPRPRRVRFRVPHAVVIVLLIAAFLGFAGIYMATSSADARGYSNLSGIFVVPIIFAVLVAGPYFRDKRSAALMRDGELAFARVTYQENIQAGKSSYSRIGYEFKASSGQLIQDQAKDLTYAVYEDMTIPVFYDPREPAKNITPCATYYQVSTDPF